MIRIGGRAVPGFALGAPVAPGTQLQVALDSAATTLASGDAYLANKRWSNAVTAYQAAGSQVAALPVTVSGNPALLAQLAATPTLASPAQAQTAQALAYQVYGAVTKLVAGSVPPVPTPAATPQTAPPTPAPAPVPAPAPAPPASPAPPEKTDWGLVVGGFAALAATVGLFALGVHAAGKT